MTNEKAFEKFILSDDWQEIRLHAQNSDELAEKVWQAAIAYMQEQSEPFGIWHVGETPEECDFFLYEDSGDVACECCIKLYTTPQRQQPLKRLSECEVQDAFNKAGGFGEVPLWTEELINAIMDEMERINK